MTTEINRIKSANLEQSFRNLVFSAVKRGSYPMDSDHIKREIDRDNSPVNLYVHIPFCDKICIFCKFHTFYNDPAKMTPFVNSLVKHINTFSDQLERSTGISSIYFGGGSPSTLSLEQVEILTKAIKPQQRVNQFTFEMHPKQVNEAYITGLKDLGINRISMGVQNFNLRERALLHRDETTPEQDLTAMGILDRSNIPFNIDLMYGTPEQTLESWIQTLKEATDTIKPTEITTYNYVDIEGTGSYKFNQKGSARRPNLNLKRQMHNETVAYLTALGYRKTSATSFSSDNAINQRGILTQNSDLLFGLGPHTYSKINDQFIINTSTMMDFIQGDRDKFVHLGLDFFRVPPTLFEKMFSVAIHSRPSRKIDLGWIGPEIISQAYGVLYTILARSPQLHSA